MQVLVYICKKKCKVMSGRDQLAVTSSKNSGTNQSVEMDWIRGTVNIYMYSKLY